jgi:hypothetical protein
MEFLIQLSFKFLVDALILFVGHEVGLEFKEGESTQEAKLTRTEKFQKGTKHISSVKSIYFFIFQIRYFEFGCEELIEGLKGIG